MSWQAYIDQIMAADANGCKAVAEAAICGFGSGSESVWASSPGMHNITVEEIKKLAGDTQAFSQCGPCIGGVKCRMLRDNLNEENMYNLDLKTASDTEGNTYNMCVGKSKTALVIVKGTKEANGGQLASKVCAMVDYLRRSNM